MVGQSNMNGYGYMVRKDNTAGKFLNGTLEWMVETYPETYGNTSSSRPTTNTSGRLFPGRHGTT
jgi:hypothetical protein